MSLTIDAHQHFWDRSRKEFDYSWQETPGMAPICRSFLPADLKPKLDAAGVDGCVLVQTQHNLAENRWALELAEQNNFILGVVGWVDLASPACAEQLAECQDHPRFVGVRHITQDEPDVDFIVRDDIVRGLETLQQRQVPFDLLFYVQHLHHAAELARRCPSLPMVIDHLSKPHIKDRRFDNWRDNLVAASKCDNIYCKLSGMVTEADWEHWQPADLKPYVETALECFGPDRCMFGSDWPVCELAATYQQVYDALVKTLGSLSDTERGEIFGGTAERFYGLRV